jgi:signal transduction histidine kinase
MSQFYVKLAQIFVVPGFNLKETNFLNGKSELATLMREKNWSKTQLGDLGSWPQSLKSTVGIMLANKFPMYIVWGPEFIQLYNDAYISILGHERHPSALGEKSKSTWPDIWPTIGPMYQRVLETGEPFGFDDYFLPRMRDGVLQDSYYSFSYNPIWDESGSVGGIAVICEETTERIQSIKSLKEMAEKEATIRARFEAIFHGSASPFVFFKGPEHIYDIFNAKYQELIPGRTLQDRPLLKVLPELEGSAYPKLISKVYETGEPSLITEELAPLLNPKTGILEDRYFDSVISRITENNGEMGVLVQPIEVTERVQARKLLEEATAEIAEIVEGMSDAFFAVNDKWIIQRVNAQFEKVIAPRADVIGKSLIEMYFNTPEQKESEYVKCYTKVMTERVSHSFVDYYEPLNIWTAVTAYPTSKGGMAVFFREITEEKKAAQRLQDAVIARDNFLSIASHELRTPITSMKLQTQLMVKKITAANGQDVSADMVKSFVQKTDKGLGRMNRLVEDMLDISRIQSGKLAMDFLPSDILSLITELKKRFSEQLDNAHIEMKIKSDHEKYVLTFDPFRMEQVFTNLITNAIRYASGKPVDVSFKDENPEYLEIIFQDHGPGIEEKNWERVFNRFERINTARDVGGLGLGLYIVREIMKSHQGTIRIEKGDIPGTRFVLKLPRR